MKGNNQPPDKKDGSKPAESNVDVFNILNSIDGFKYSDIKKNKKKRKNLNNQIKEDFENYNEFSPKKKGLKNNSSYNNLNELSVVNELKNDIKENIKKSKSYGMLEELVKQINNETQSNKLNIVNYNIDETNSNILRKIKSVNSLVDIDIIENKDKTNKENKSINQEKKIKKKYNKFF